VSLEIFHQIIIIM